MTSKTKFYIIKISSNDFRREMLNVGVLLQYEGSFIVRFPARLDKIKAISAALSPEAIKDDLLALPNILKTFSISSLDNQQAQRVLSNMTPFQIVDGGYYDSSTPHIFELQVDNIIKSYISPEPAPIKALPKRGKKLRQDISSVLRSERVLAKRNENIDSHRVMSKYEISEGIKIDFLLKNGAMHVMETVDASSDLSTIRSAISDIAISALTFEHAKMKFSQDVIKPKLIYNAASHIEKVMEPSLQAASHQGAELVNWESEEQRTKFIVELTSLAEPLQSKNEESRKIHASAQSSFLIN